MAVTHYFAVVYYVAKQMWCAVVCNMEICEPQAKSQHSARMSWLYLTLLYTYVHKK